jgi:hypothetical protein
VQRVEQRPIKGKKVFQRAVEAAADITLRHVVNGSVPSIVVLISVGRAACRGKVEFLVGPGNKC